MAWTEIWITLQLLSGRNADWVLSEERHQEKAEAVCLEARRQAAAGVRIRWGSSDPAKVFGAMGAASDGKQFYVAWLKDRYGYQIAKLNSAYGLEATSFSELLERDLSRVDRVRQAVAKDDEVFEGELRASVVEKLRRAIGECGPQLKVMWAAD